jgi:hypothetical protein
MLSAALTLIAVYSSRLMDLARRRSDGSLVRLRCDDLCFSFGAFDDVFGAGASVDFYCANLI